MEKIKGLYRRRAQGLGPDLRGHTLVYPSSFLRVCPSNQYCQVYEFSSFGWPLKTPLATLPTWASGLWFILIKIPTQFLSSGLVIEMVRSVSQRSRSSSFWWGCGCGHSHTQTRPTKGRGHENSQSSTLQQPMPIGMAPILGPTKPLVSGKSRLEPRSVLVNKRFWMTSKISFQT